MNPGRETGENRHGTIALLPVLLYYGVYRNRGRKISTTLRLEGPWILSLGLRLECVCVCVRVRARVRAGAGVVIASQRFPSLPSRNQELVKYPRDVGSIAGFMTSYLPSMWTQQITSPL